MTLKPVYIKAPDEGVEDDGWYVRYPDGKLEGPFNTEEDAWDWINRPSPSEPGM